MRESPMREPKLGLITLLVSFIAGALLVGAFAPLEWWPLSFFSMALYLYLCRDISANNAMWVGLAFGYGQFGVGVSWVYVSLHTYGGMPLWMGSIAVILFAGILAVFAALTSYSAARLFPNGGWQRILAMALLWIVFEWLRSWIFTGFPWLELGYSQTPSWLLGLASVGGVYLVSLAVTLIAACITCAILYSHKIVSIVGLILILITSYFVQLQVWSQPSGGQVTVGLVQGNVEIDKKWQAQYRDGVIARLMALTKEMHEQQINDGSNLDLIVWPETALPLYYQQTDSTFWQQLNPTGTPLLTGLVDNPSLDQSYNAAVLTCQGEQKIYRKRHLVPFGEYLPMRFLLNWLLEYLQLPMSDFSSSEGVQTLKCGDQIHIGLSICYEDAFASEMRTYMGDASLLVNISEDAWFGDSLAPHQRLQMAQMRARELSRPLVRSANSGPSVVIDERGTVLARTGQFKQATLAYDVQPQRGATPYKRFGNWIIWLALAILLILKITTRKLP